MRVLTSTVLIMEAIVLGLAIPVALVAGGYPAVVGWVLGLLALALLVLPGMFARPFFVPAGWSLQGAVLACGLLVPMLLPLGALFTALWWTALHLGRKVEQSRAERAGAHQPGAQQ